MTSADVAWTLEKDKENEPYASLVESFESAEAKGPYTVVFKTKSPFPELTEILSEWAFVIMPKDFAGMSEKEFEAKPIGTGPFELVKWEKGNAATFEKNKYYWRPNEPYLDKVVFKTVPNPQSRTAQLRSGQLQAMASAPIQELESLEEAGQVVIETSKNYNWLIVLNTQAEPFEDIRVREAFDLALNREAMVQTALLGRGEPAGSWLAPASRVHDSSITPPKQDLAKARQLLGEAVKDGVNPSFSLIVPNEIPFWTTAAQVAQQNLEEAGFTVAIKKQDGNSAQTAAAEGEYQAETAYMNIEVPSPVEAYAWYTGSNGFWTGSPLNKMEKLFADARSEPNPAKREALWTEMQKINDEEKGMISAAYAPQNWVHASDLTGLQLGILGVPFLNAAGFTN